MRQAMSRQTPRPRVILSFDFEIGWGDITNPNWARREANGVYDRLRHVLPEILGEMDRLEIPATFATVGAMFDNPSRRSLDHLPPGASEVVCDVLKGAKASSFDGRDLFERVLGASAGHSIASHSYSHVPFTHEGVDAAFVREDLRQFKRVLGSYGLSTDRFVFPENREGYHSTLVEEGFRQIRVAAKNRFANRFLYLATIAIVPPPMVEEIAGPQGCVRHHGSMLFNDAGRRSRIPLLMRRVELGISRLRKDGGAFHIWSHPFNFAESDALKASFITMLKRLAAERDAGHLEIGTL